MEDLRQVATAYFYSAPEDVKQQAYGLFRVMDIDGDGKISSYEFKQYVQQVGYNMIHPNFFNELDHDGNGRLDFWELVTFFYVVKTRTSLCSHCRAYLMRLYFTCVECFEHANNSYDLCLSCYRERQFQHHHTFFLDNHVMLMRRHPAFASNRPSSITAQPQPQPQPQTHYPAVATQSNWHKLKQAFEALELGISAWAVAGSLGCSIM